MNFLNGMMVIATNNILCASFVSPNTSQSFAVQQSTTGDKPIGISGSGPYIAPNLQNAIAFQNAGTLSTNLAAASGIPLDLFGPGDICWLTLGTGGGCNPGDYLKPDAMGNGLATSSANDQVAARSFQSGNAGDLVVVLVCDRKL
jgi:hypothetical protein